MTAINVFLNFNGNCEEVFLFYQSIIGGEFAYVSRYGELEGDEYQINEKYKNKIMHISLPIGNSVLMGSDINPECTPNFRKGNNFSVAYTAESKEKADMVFSALSEGGEVWVPLNRTLLGYYFGILTDKFGIKWMLNFTEGTQE